jgi:hypothetical protein
MKVELFVLCDAATDYSGKLNILGAFDTIWARTVPVVHPSCSVAARIRFSRIEEGSHTIRINIVDADGNAVIKPFETTGDINFKEAGVSSVATNMVLNLHGLKFPVFGEYSIDLAVDGRQEASLPLHVNRVPEKA